MTTITFKGVSSGKTRIAVYHSLDVLKRELQTGKMDKSNGQFIIPRGKKQESEIVYAVSFDQDDESATLFRKYKIIPKEDEYPDREEKEL